MNCLLVLNEKMVKKNKFVLIFFLFFLIIIFFFKLGIIFEWKIKVYFLYIRCDKLKI